jgi:hypothetical protein
MLATPVGAELFHYLGLHLALPALHPVDEFRAPTWISDAPLAVYVVGALAAALLVRPRRLVLVLPAAALGALAARGEVVALGPADEHRTWLPADRYAALREAVEGAEDRLDVPEAEPPQLRAAGERRLEAFGPDPRRRALDLDHVAGERAARAEHHHAPDDALAPDHRRLGDAAVAHRDRAGDDAALREPGVAQGPVSLGQDLAAARPHGLEVGIEQRAVVPRQRLQERVLDRYLDRHRPRTA